MAKRFLILMLVLMALPLVAQEAPPRGPVFVSEPAIPTVSPAVRDLPDPGANPNMFGLEMKRREDYGFIPTPYSIEPKVDPLMELNLKAPGASPEAFNAPLYNFAGMTSPSSPPDDTGDIGLSHFLQGINGSGSFSTSTVGVFAKTTGTNVKTFSMQSLASGAPCNSGYCDPIVLYDRMADRWIVSEFPSSGGHLCVYVSTTGDPTGTWYAYYFANVESGTPDYPKYGVWPQNGNGGSYFVGINAGATGVHDVVALDRAKMLAGQPATYQKFTVPDLPNSGFQLVLPANQQGKVAPPNGSPAIVMRPRDDEAQDGANTPTYDLLEMWAISVDWTTPANSTISQLTSLHMADYDMTLCGMGSIWNCMPQPGTTQKIDPIREPVHFPLQYRNFGDHESVVGCFVEDVDGTDHAALRWFEVRKTGGVWSLYQEGVVGGEANVHRSVGSTSIDSSGNIAMGYTRTGTTAPYYPSIYYKGRLSSDPLGTMPQGEYVIQDATTSKTGNERWGDYAGIGVDPVDDCTFWFTTEYGGSGQTRIAAFKFDACGCLSTPAAPVATATAPSANRIDVGWNDSATATITRYYVYRSLSAGGPYTLLATVPDSSPGVGGGASYTYHDDTVSGGTKYYYTVKSNDGAACTSPASNEVSATATGVCTLPPTFAGLTSVTNPAGTTCTLNLSWSAGASNCSGALSYKVYRSITYPFTPGGGNLIASGVGGTTYSDSGSLTSGTAYYYIVRAVDGANGAEEANTVAQSGVPTGPITTSTLTDTFEGALSGGGFDLAGWTHSAVNGTTNWAWSTAQHHDGTHSWYAQDIATTSDMVLVSPSFGVGATTTLSFWHTYAFEGTTSSCYDGGTLEYSADGTTWTVVPAADFTAGTYTGTVNSGYSNPIGGKAGWCAGTVGTMTQVAVNLHGDANLMNKTIQLRWHEGNDSSTASTGWYVDSVVIANAATMGTCSTSSGCTAPGAPTLTGATGTCSGVNLAWTAGTGTTNGYNVYRSANTSCPVGTLTKLNASPLGASTLSYSDTTAAAGTTYTYVVRGACDAGGATESVNSNCLPAVRLVSPVPTITGASANACPATTVLLTTESGKSGYVWSMGGTPIGGATAYQYAAAATGSYTVSYTDTNGCSGTSVAKAVTITACVPNIVYQTHGAFTPVDTNGNATMEAGEKWSVQVTLQNTGNTAASNVQASLSGMAAGDGITGCNNPGTYGTIAAGGTASYTYVFVVDPAKWYTTYACGTNLTINVVNKSTTTSGCPCTDEMAVFSNQVGIAGGNQTATQVLTPLNATSGTVNSNLSSAFTLASADTATLSYTSAYTPTGGGTATLFGPDDMRTLANWTASGYSATTGAPAPTCHTTNTYTARSNNTNGTFYLTKTASISTIGYSNITVAMDWRVNGASATQFLDWSTNGTTWNNGAANTANNGWLCSRSVVLPAGAAGQATLYIRFRTVSSGSRGSVDYVRITGTAPGSGTWTANAQVSLVDPSSTVTVLKAYGAADASPYNVKPYYTGPGTYVLRLAENSGGTATVTNGSMNVTKGGTCGTWSASCAVAPPSETAPGSDVSTAQTWSDKNNQAWPSNSQAASYRLYRGQLSGLPNLLNSSNDSCKRYDGTSTTANTPDDPAALAAGDFFWYLVVGVNGGGEGSAGSATAGLRTINSTGACP